MPVETAGFLIMNFFFPFFLAFMALLLGLASFGASLGLRRKYVELLIKIFEFGRERIERAEQRNNHEDSDEGEPDKVSNGLLKLPDSEGRKISVISRETHIVPEPPKRKTSKNNGGSSGDSAEDEEEDEVKKEFQMADAMNFVKAGIEAVIDDEVTKRFDTAELASWNLLTRSNRNYHYISMRLTILWGIGFIFRYFCLLPVRVLITIFGIGWMVLCTAAIGCVPDGKLKKWLYWHVSLMCFRILSRAFSAIVTYHDRENYRAKGGGICVANHTSPIDVVILSSDNCYALVGQRQGGLLGLLQRALARATSHIWFEREEMRDRAAVAKRLRAHVENLDKLPILIFPEGTCINNTSVMMFKKGSFEVGGTIYPVAIKYDPIFGDPFWNSSKQGYIMYLLMMMSSWAIVCDVWYLPPMYRRENESAVDFAKRVKAVIAARGGLVDLEWDGQLKRMAVKAEWKAWQQEEYSRHIKIN